jgi:3',5'-cyclic AMP phosphodiesterase CpdA
MKPTIHTYSRRGFLQTGAGVVAAAAASAAEDKTSTVRFGMLADIHHSRMPDAHSRLEAFLTAAGRRELDFLIQLGDFCDGYAAQLTPEQKQFVADWHKVRVPHYSVLGNHEMDHGDKKHIMDVLEMRKNYYSFDVRGIHFVVLDCMHLMENGKVIDYAAGNYFKHPQDDINLVDPEQMEWLSADLKATKEPTLVFTHPCINGFWYKGAEVTRANVRALFSQVNKEVGWSKVAACFSGHHHVDDLSQLGGVNYFLVNSASYFWVGEQYGSLAKYRDPLFTFVTVNAAGKITLEGTHSEFLPPTPTELHFPEANMLTASIQPRTVSFKSASRS